jgi:hypothetical protein
MKTAIIIVGAVIVSGIAYVAWDRLNVHSSTAPVFVTQGECEQKSGSICEFQMCDYQCPPDFKKGWVKQ